MSFYKYDGKQLFSGPTRVVGPGFTLFAYNPADRIRIVDGWRWFETEDEARTAFNLPAKVDNEPKTTP